MYDLNGSIVQNTVSSPPAYRQEDRATLAVAEMLALRKPGGLAWKVCLEKLEPTL